MLPENGKISIADVWRELNPPMDPKDCDYYFETYNKLDFKIQQGWIYNKNETLGFGDSVTDLSGFRDTCSIMEGTLYAAPKKIVARNATNLSRMFENTDIIEVEYDIFDECKKAIDFSSCFSNCSKITSALPDVWNKKKFPNVINGTNYAKGCINAANYNEIPSNFGGPSTNPEVPLSIKQKEEPINNQKIITKSIERIVDDRLPDGPIALGDVDVRELAGVLVKPAIKITDEWSKYSIKHKLLISTEPELSKLNIGDYYKINISAIDKIKNSPDPESPDPGEDLPIDPDVPSSLSVNIFVNSNFKISLKLTKESGYLSSTSLFKTEETNDIFLCKSSHVPSCSNDLKPIQSTISLYDLHGKGEIRTPQECDYYFETRADFDARRDQILAENNNDLSQKTFGFGNLVSDLSFAFKQTNVISTPKMIFARNVTNFEDLFSGCSSLKNISKLLFKYCVSAKNIKGIFYKTSISSIPLGLFDSFVNATIFQGCFNECTSLTSIPQGLFDKNVNATDFYKCFSFCFSLTTIPQGLFDKNVNVTNFRLCFNCCSSITSALPDVWNKTKFPKVTHGGMYACDCRKAANYNEIPDNFK